MPTDARQTPRLQATVAAAKARGLLPADAALPQTQRPSWIILALSFAGAQLAVWPFLFFLGSVFYDWLDQAISTLALSAGFLAAGVYMLRTQAAKGMFLTQLALNVLLVGLGLLTWGLHQLDWQRSPLPLLAASLLPLAFLIRVPWVQSLLGVAFAAVVAHVDWYAWLGLGGELDESIFWMQLHWPSLWLLAAACWAWCASESRWGGKPWVPKMHALMSGVAVGLLLVILLAAHIHFSAGFQGRRGSADVLDAGQQALFHFNLYTICASLLVLAAGLWLARHWGGWPGAQPAKDQAAPDCQAFTWQTGATWALLYGLWTVAALIMPIMGVLAVLLTVALATGRRRVLFLALAVVLAQLSAFYYALQWPLAHKAALLGALGGVLALALWGLHASQKRIAKRRMMPGQAPADAGPHPGWLRVQRAGLALALLLTLGLSQWDATRKEQVLAQGQAIYLPLVPMDPRSLMQGDYMALNFDIPSELLSGDTEAPRPQDHDALNPLLGRALMVAKRNARGIATLHRRYQPQEALAADEVIVPLKHLKGRWVVVTDAYFFPEGQGRVFRNARYGEFRVLDEGKVLLAGLTDEQLRRIEPKPDAPGSADDVETGDAADAPASAAQAASPDAGDVTIEDAAVAAPSPAASTASAAAEAGQ
ncbi:MAG: GDYXXLXY domain-containing protein [Brachymonas sp.]|nr:GDYXXLXY domain-containing protein [Brachymonas sp.]